MMTTAELAQKVDRLTVEHLKIIIKTHINGSSTKTVNEDFLTFGIATEVLRFFFGNAWTNENIFPMHQDVSPQHRRGRKFLKTDSQDHDEQFLHMERVTNLAEIIFNLQGIEGLKQRITIMNNHDMESALGEFECAALLSSPEFKFRFINPSGVKGQDYEGEIVSSAGRLICCEMKSKSELTVPDELTLWRTFDVARQQLPKDQPGIVLIKIPETWVRYSMISSIVNNAVEKVFRQSQRLVGVVVTWSEKHNTDEEMLFLIKLKDYPNRQSKLFDNDISEIFAKLGRAHSPLWVQFRSLVVNTVDEYA